MLIGYARVSTPGQDFALQKDALKKAGCERVFTDVASGAKAARPGLAEALDYLRAGDTLVVWRLDRLGRSLSHLIEVVRDLNDDGVGFRALQEQIDTTTAGGKLVFHVQAIGDTEGALKLRIDEVGKGQLEMHERLGALQDQLAKVEDDLTIIKEYLAATVRSQSGTRTPDESRLSADGGSSEESAT